MSRRPAPLSSLAARVAHAQDSALRRREGLPNVRDAWARHCASRHARRRWELLGHALAGAAAAATVLLWWELRPLRYQLEGLDAENVGTVHTLQSRSTQGTMAFSDGSLVRVEPRARVHIESITRRGAAIRLDQGALTAKVVHERDAGWSFRAGPFDVAVVGTQFDLAWSDADKSLAVVMHQGEVRISGCSLHNIVLRQDESVTLKCPAGRPGIVVPATSASAEAPSDVATEPSETPSATPLPEDSSPARIARLADDSPVEDPPPAEEPPDAAKPDWRVAGARGHLREAYAAADAAGFEAECDRATGRELLDLSDAALFAGRADRAVAALLAARARFPGTSASATAAFKLGRIGSGGGGARSWFQTYLREAPTGPLAREALGRLIEIDHGAGNQASARALAEEYLRKYPQGPHAELARSLLGP